MSLLCWLSELQAYGDELESEVTQAAADSDIHVRNAHFKHLLNYLLSTYDQTLKTLKSLTSHGEITFDLLWALYNLKARRLAAVHIVRHYRSSTLYRFQDRMAAGFYSKCACEFGPHCRG